MTIKDADRLNLLHEKYAKTMFKKLEPALKKIDKGEIVSLYIPSDKNFNDVKLVAAFYKDGKFYFRSETHDTLVDDFEKFADLISIGALIQKSKEEFVKSRKKNGRFPA